MYVRPRNCKLPLALVLNMTQPRYCHTDRDAIMKNTQNRTHIYNANASLYGGVTLSRIKYVF